MMRNLNNKNDFKEDSMLNKDLTVSLILTITFQINDHNDNCFSIKEQFFPKSNKAQPLNVLYIQVLSLWLEPQHFL